MKKWKVSIGVIAVLVLLGAYLLAPEPKAGDGLTADKLCRKLLTEKENRDALEWMKESGPGNVRTLGEQSQEESLGIVKSLYAAGAVKAQVIGIERLSGYGETSNIVCVELPAAPRSRQELFKIEAKMASNEGFDPVPDEGQIYLFLYKFKLSGWQALRAFLHL